MTSHPALPSLPPTLRAARAAALVQAAGCLIIAGLACLVAMLTDTFADQPDSAAHRSSVADIHRALAIAGISVACAVLLAGAGVLLATDWQRGARLVLAAAQLGVLAVCARWFDVTANRLGLALWVVGIGSAAGILRLLATPTHRGAALPSEGALR